LSLHIPVSAGGGLNNRRGGTVTITNSTISQNTAGSGDTNNAFGGGIASSGYMNIENTTVSGNTAIADHDISRCTPSKSFCHQYIAWSAGGGIMNGFYATLVLLNSTISQNDAGSNSIGGGIFSGGPTGEALLIHTTITGNHATTAGGGLEGSTFKLSRSLIAGNNCTYCAFFETAREAAIGNAQADDFNLFGHSDDSGISGFTPGKTDIVGRKELNKILGPLTNNGGPTLSHSLVKGSPAINAAPIDANCPTTDQRGMARPQGKGCDIGAVEWTGGSSSKKGR
jgi:hypothetical protein